MIVGSNLCWVIAWIVLLPGYLCGNGGASGAACKLLTYGLAWLIVPVHLRDLAVRREQRVELIVADLDGYL